MIEVRDNIDFNEYIESLMVNYESDDLEFKSAAGGFPGSFWDTYSAFANSDGGVIVLGVAEKHNQFYLDGLTEEQLLKYRKDFWNNANNKATISCNLLTEKDIEVGDYKGHKIMLFYIPRASREQRPVYRTTQPFNGTFKRNFEGDYRCSESEVRRMFADADENHPADSRILKGYTMDDIDLEALNGYRQRFKASSPDHPWLSLTDLDLLKMLGGYRKDRQTGEEGFTVAGLLMFGKTQSITDVECCPHYFPDYQEHLTEDEDIRWTNRICPDGTWEANLFNFYQRVLPRLQSVLPKPFKLEGNIRKEETPAHIAIREALINLCIHADYSVNATLVVRHNLKGFVFSNPGTLLVSKDQYYTGGESVCRNKSLQKMFSMLGVAEKAGGGTSKILKGWQEQNWRSPKIEEKQQPDKVVLEMSMESLLSENAKNELMAKFGITANTFDHNVMSVLALAIDEGSVTNERLRYSLNMHKGEIADLLRRMVRNHLLVAKGYGRGTSYHLPKESFDILGAKVATSKAKVATSKAKVATSIAKVATSKANIATSGSNIATSDANIATSASNMVTSDANMVTSSSNMVTSDPYIASLLKKKRLTKSQLYELIKYMCSDWLSLEDLAIATKRKQVYLRNKVLPELLQSKVLEMLYPGTPNHPKQKYKVKD